MTTITIPPLPYEQFELGFISSAITQNGGSGPSQRIAMLGDRHTLKAVLRTLNYVQGVSLSAKLKKGITTKLAVAIWQGDMKIGSPGSPVFGTGAGESLSATGFSAGYHIQDGQYFSLVSGGNRYLHQVVGAVTATGGGTATLSITPMLRITPTAGDVLEFAQPYIEGWLSDPSHSYTVGLTRTITHTFNMIEAQ